MIDLAYTTLPYTMENYMEDLVKDAKIRVEEFYDENDSAAMPTPYANLSDLYDVKRTYSVRFPAKTTEVDRPTQYYILSRFFSQLNKSRIGVVAVMKIDIPARPEIPEQWWNRSCPAMLIGVTADVSLSDSSPYIVHIILFDHFDGKLEFFQITDMRIWEDFVDHTSIFRDFLIFGQNTIDTGTYDIGTFYVTLKNLGFVFEMEDEDAKFFFASQEDFVLPPNMLYSSL
jgi:hypothetical protein